DTDDAGNLAQRFRGSGPARAALEAVWQYWKHTLGAVHVETPDRSINVLTNGWLLYQTLACRVWARSGYYQSGGAFGFRAPLQDTLYHHCVRAILRGLRFGVHGLPLIGSGDWNDGMNLVGKDGKGESVWLGFFLYRVLIEFTGIAQGRKDTSFVQRCQSEAAQ